MTLQQTMAALEAAGSEKTRKIYTKHGAGSKQFGVSFAEIGKLQKVIKRDHTLAVKLWATGNYEARVLATMIADPAAIGSAELDAWLAGLRSYGLVELLARNVAANRPDVREMFERWSASKAEYTAQAGWELLASAAGKETALQDDYVLAQLQRIEREIHNAPNRARHAMNNALIAIGLRNAKTEKAALAAAARIGKVNVDHGETGCKTPEAAAYIAKTKAYRASRAKGLFQRRIRS